MVHMFYVAGTLGWLPRFIRIDERIPAPLERESDTAKERVGSRPYFCKMVPDGASRSAVRYSGEIVGEIGAASGEKHAGGDHLREA